MSQSTETAFSRTASSPSAGLFRLLGRAVVATADTVAIWQERRHQRRALEALPDHLLRDIGVSRADAEHEADKPFWQG